MRKSNLCGYSDAYVLVKGTITITGSGPRNAANWIDKTNIEIIFSKCASFIDCINKITNFEVNNIKDLDGVLTRYNLIEWSNNYLEKSWSLWHYYKGELAATINNSDSFKFKIKITGKTLVTGNTKDNGIVIPLKCLSNFWRTLEMYLIDYNVNLILTWSADCVNSFANGTKNFQ